MKTITKTLMMGAILILLSIHTTYAQTTQTMNEFKKAPLNTERVVGIITQVLYDNHQPTEETMMERLMEKAKKMYGNSYPNYHIRDFKYKLEHPGWRVSATVVVTDPKEVANEELSRAIDKALSEVREGSRIAIDQIKVVSGIDKEEYQDQVVEILLDKGYKVVAKEYLEKLYEEQKNQQSGIYNEKTTVQENNFSAVGYYLNVKLTETSLRVQAINVSTGEYAGNATVKLE